MCLSDSPDPIEQAQEAEQVKAEQVKAEQVKSEQVKPDQIGKLESLESLEKQDQHWMQEALTQAQKAYSLGEVPIGAVIVYQNTIIGKGYNLRETTQDPTTHAEIIAIREAAQVIGSWRLIDCTLYATLEPCAMCAGAIVNARITRCVFGARDPKGGAVYSLYQLLTDPRLNHRVNVEEGCLQEASAEMLSSFFRAIREGRGKPKPRKNLLVEE